MQGVHPAFFLNNPGECYGHAKMITLKNHNKRLPSGLWNQMIML